MYLLSQIWWYLLLAFLLGALVGYLLWRVCNRPMLESRFERSRKDMASRLSLLEDERAKFTGDGRDAGVEAAKLRSELANLKASFADNTKSATAARDDESMFRAEVAALKKRISEADAEAAKHAADVKKARDEATASLAAAHAAEVKKLHETAKSHEAKVMSLSQADTSARQEMESAKSRHADELKKARDQVAAEWTAKHAADVKKARDEAAAEATRKHADELEKAKSATAALATAGHDAALKAAREAAAAEAARRHSDDITKLKNDHAAALARHADDLAKARSTVVAAAAVASPVAAKSAPAADHAKADDLKLIWGVGPEIEKLLNEHGIHRFEQIANWTGKDLAWFDGLLPAFKGRAVSEKWIEQCRRLASGWRPEREIGDKPKDILSGPRGGRADDLKLIWGVGPKLEAMLNAAGFYHFDQIAKWTGREIEWVDTQLGDFAGRAVRDKWVEQCTKLATGWRPASDVGERPK